MKKSVKFSSNNFYNIIEHLYISDQIASFDEQLIKKNNINCLINCTKNTPFLFNDTINIHIHFIHSPNNYTSTKIINKTDKIINYMNKLIKNKSNILVYCENGNDKSLVIIFCYLIKYYSKNYISNISSIIQYMNTKINNINFFYSSDDINLCKSYRNFLLDNDWIKNNSIISNSSNSSDSSDGNITKTSSSSIIKFIKKHISNY